MVKPKTKSIGLTAEARKRIKHLQWKFDHEKRWHNQEPSEYLNCLETALAERRFNILG